MIDALFAAIWFYLFPILTGRAILSWFKKAQSPWVLCEYFVIGGLALYALAFGIQGAGLLTPTGIFPALIGLHAVVLATNGVQLIWKFQRYQCNINKIPKINLLKRKGGPSTSLRAAITPLLLISIVAIAAFSIWHWNTPLPSTLNWDIFEHQTLVNQIQSGQFSFTASKISDTFQFDGYSTLFHWLLTIPQALFSPHALEFWWLVEGIHLFLSILAVYTLAYSITRSRFTASVAAIIGAFSFESYVAYSTLFLVPQTFTAVAFAFGLGYMIKITHNAQPTTHNHFWFLPFLFLFLILNHYIIGGAAIAILMGCIILRLLLTRWPKSYLIWLIVAPFLVYLVLNFLGTRINVAAINGGEALQYLYTFDKLMEFMQVFFGYALVALVPFGVIASFQRRKVPLQILTVSGATIMAVILSGIPYALKFYVLNHYIMTAVAAIGVALWVRPHIGRLTKIAILAILFIWFSSHLVLNSVYWKNDLHYGAITTHVSANEISAAEFIRHRYGGTNTLMVSDPSTQYVAEALSGVNSQGGAYMKAKTRQTVATIVQLDTPLALSDALYGIGDSAQPEDPQTVVLLLSGRFFQWVEAGPARQQDVSYNIWTPALLSPGQKDHIRSMVERYNLKTVYENSDMVIVEVPDPSSL